MIFSLVVRSRATLNRSNAIPVIGQEAKRRVAEPGR